MYTYSDMSLLNGYSNLDAYIKDVDKEMYNWTIPSSLNLMSKETKRKFYEDKIMTLVESIDNYIGKNYFSSSLFVGIANKAREVLYLLVTIFKSYTVDLLDSNVYLKIDNQSFNSLRIFDEYEGSTVSDQTVDRIDLVDVYKIKKITEV
jgi:hypothetical protein